MSKRKHIYQDLPECCYSVDVECSLTGRTCEKCGFNPDVSYRRIVEKYGEEKAAYLSVPKQEG